MKTNRLAKPADSGGALSHRFSAITNTVGKSPGVQIGRAQARLAWITVVSACIVSSASAATAVTLAWDANPETGVTGYQLSYGTSPGVYPNAIDPGTNTTASVPGLTEGTTYYFVVSAINQAGLLSPRSSEISYQVPVIPANNAPVAASKSVTTAEGAPLPITLGGTDVDGNALTFAILGGPANGTLAGTVPNLTYNPAANFSGSDQFTFRANDGTADSAPATISITVTPVPAIPVNTAPVFTRNPISAAATEDLAFSGQLVAADANTGDVLTFAKVSGPAWLTVSANGMLGGTPLNSNVGTNSLTVQVSDPFNASSTATLIITVANTNDAPFFKTSPLVFPAGTEKTPYQNQTLAATATDPDAGDSPGYTKISGPAWLTVSTTGALGGTPPAGGAGPNEFTIRASDSAGAFADAILQIKINPALPLPWNIDRIGTTNLAGAASFNAGIFTVAGSGTLANTADAANYLWQTLSGDGEITARVSTLGNPGTATRVGVMIRESLAANSRQVFIGLNGVGDFQWLRRTSTGGTAATTSSKGKQTPNAWLRLVRKGGTITASKSNDAASWASLGTSTIALPANCYIGLAVSSGNDDLLNTSQFSNVSVTP